jgi:UDP-glucose 4-epimerase
MARVLVTGGAGFIGSHLVHALVARGDQVRVLDNFSTGKRENLAGLENDIELIEGDLLESVQVEKALQHAEFVFHEAAFISVPESIENPRACYQVNVQGTIELLEASRQAGCKRVVLASSAAVYGASQDMPLRESAPPECLSPYAASKLFNETLAKLYSQAYKLPVVALRYFNVFGPRQSPTSAYAAVIPKFIESLHKGSAPIVFGDGRQTRDFIFVEDVVHANLLAAGAQDAPGGVLNICSGQETSLLYLLNVLYSLFPKSPKAKFAEPRLGDVPRSLGDPSAAAAALGFRSEISLQAGLKHCVEAWQA